MEIISSDAGSVQVLLPPDVLQLVLQHVDLPQRLGPCALVCRAWRAAANAATSDIERNVNQQHATGLSGWLQLHGGHVAQLQVTGACPMPDLVLPCHQLTKLDTLEVVKADVRPINARFGCSPECCSSRGSSSDSSGPEQQHLAALTRLTQLWLEKVQWAGSLKPLSSLTNLRELHLEDLKCLGDDPPGNGASDTFYAAVGSAVPHLVQLTSLCLYTFDYCSSDRMGDDDASLAHISCLQQLQELQLHGVNLSPAGMAALSQSLTRLHLGDWTYGVLGEWGYNLSKDGLSSNDTPPLAQLTALQHLELIVKGQLEPAVLSHMAQLTHLDLYCSDWVPAGSAGTAALLAAVASMTLLQHLVLENCLTDSYAPAAAYAALTASSHLTQLDILRNWNVPPLPAGALNHMFAADRRLPGLRQMNLVFKHLSEEQQQQLLEEEEQQLLQQLMLDVQVLGQQGFDQLLRCCPGLHSLDLLAAFPTFAVAGQLPIKLDGLLALSGLTYLALKGLSVDEEGFTNTVAQLTGLRCLTLEHTDVSYAVLLQLTKLRQLERLHLFSQHGRLLVENVKADVHGSLKQGTFDEDAVQAAPGCPPYVWQQLQEYCVTSCKNCARLVLLQKDAQLQEAQEQLAEARQQLAAQQAQHEALLAQLQ